MGERSMSKHRRKDKRTSISLQRIEIPLAITRDVILEHDETYKDNLVSLCNRINSGKVQPDMFRRIQPHLAMSAMRRAGVNLRNSVQMLRA